MRSTGVIGNTLRGMPFSRYLGMCFSGTQLVFLRTQHHAQQIMSVPLLVFFVCQFLHFPFFIF
jgi:hypothetical protein